MGMSFDLHTYTVTDIVNELNFELSKAGKEEVATREEVLEVLPHFGILDSNGENYVTMWNEYYSDSGYNAGSELFRFFEAKYGLEDLFLGGYGYGPGGVNADEVWQELYDEEMPDSGDNY